MTETARRSHDPFAPHSRSTTGGGHPEPVGAPQDEPETGPSEPSGVSSSQDETDTDELDDMRRVELLALAESEGVAPYGNKADLIARIRKHRQG